MLHFLNQISHKNANKMKITKRQLKRIIKEELEMHLTPAGLDDMGPEGVYGLGYYAGKDVVIEPSDIQGMGVFTDRDFRQGEEVGVCHIRSPESGWDVTELGRYHNHSEEPNCANVMDRNVRRLHALRDLPVGTEITVDYREQSDLEQPEESWCT